MAPGPLIAPPFLDDEAQVYPAAAEDVLDRLPGPGAPVGETVAVEALGDLGQGVLSEVAPDPPDDGRLLGDDLELAGMDESAGRVVEAPVTEGVMAAMAALAAEHASGDEEIRDFRERVLHRDGPMSSDEAEAYLELPKAKEPPRAPMAGHAELLQYRNERLFHDLHVWTGTPLDQLRLLALRLAQSYPWQPAEAAAFVLEGFIPRASPFLVNLPQTWHPTRPRRERLVMEVDLWMPASVVLRAYREYQRKVLPGHNRPVGQKSIDLVNFVFRHRPATWQQLLDRWNNEHPVAPYPDYRRFRYAFMRARQSLLYPGYWFQI